MDRTRILEQRTTTIIFKKASLCLPDGLISSPLFFPKKSEDHSLYSTDGLEPSVIIVQDGNKR